MTRPTAVSAVTARQGRLRAIAMIAVFDVAGPLVTYNLLRSTGMSAVTALVLSGVFPAFGVAAGIIQHRRLDVIGALVLAGIAVGTVLGLASRNARLVLVEGSVPTGVFGVAFLVSIWAHRPLVFRFAVEFMGPDTPRGREFASRWRYPAFRRALRLITAVWGVGLLVEAAARLVIVLNTSTGTALAISKVMLYAFIAVLSAWSAGYGSYARRKRERLIAAAAASEVPAVQGDR